MMGAWIVFAVLVFTLFAFLVVDGEHEKTNRRLKGALNQARADLLHSHNVSLIQARRINEHKARVAGLEFTITQMAEAAANQLGEPIYDEMAVARLKRELNEYGWGSA